MISLPRTISITATFAITGLGACTNLVDFPLDPRAEQINSPTVYRRWWSMVESCSKLQGSFDQVSWLVVPNSDLVDRDGKYVAAYWAPVSNRIILAGNEEFNGSIVRHEMLHALIGPRSGHPREYFIDLCGGVVSCGPDCVSDAGAAPPPPTNAIVVDRDKLRLDASLIPAEPSASAEEGMFTVAVTATNPNTYPIVIQLESIQRNEAFSYTLSGDDLVGQSERIFDASQTYFRGGETKRRYFDLTLTGNAGARAIAPGSYTLVGGFNGVKTDPVPVILR